MNYYLINSAGVVMESGNCQREVAHLYHRDGLTFREGDAKVGQIVRGEAVLDLPERPTIAHDFDASQYRWVPNVAKLATLIRADRDRLLSATDWTQLNDVPESTRTTYATYRQALRDVPQQSGFPDNIVWPNKPE